MAFVLAAAAAGLCPTWAAGQPLPDFIPADTRVVIGIELRHILDSSLVRSLSGEAAKLPAFQFGGVDFAKDVDQLLVVSNGAGQNAPGLLIARGRFHPGRGNTYHGVPLAGGPERSGGLIAVLDESTAILGEADQVHAAIDRRGRGAGTAAALAARVQDLAGRYDIWALGDHLPQTGQAGPADAVDAFSFGASIRDGLDIAAEIHLRSAADAEKVTAPLKIIEAMLKTQAGSSRFNLQTKDGVIQVSLFVPEEELKKGIQSKRAAIAAALQNGISLPKPRSEGRIQTDARGDTVSVTLPGGPR